MASLKDQRVLVVGGSSGIGLATAIRAAELGAAVTIVSRSTEKLDRAAKLIGQKVETFVLDTGDASALEEFFSSRAPWDHIVVSAAQTPGGPVRTLALDQADSAMQSKFWGAYRIAKFAKFAERGTLILVSGFLAERPSASSVLQGAINAALEALARGLALELSPIRVNTISPGLIETPLWDKMEKHSRDAMFEKAAKNLPAKTVGKPEDIANAAIFLMTTPFATGSTVRVDGGGVIA